MTSVNAHTTPSYNIINDLDQSPTTISTLEVFKNFQIQCKALLFSLGSIEAIDAHLMTFELDHFEP